MNGENMGDFDRRQYLKFIAAKRNKIGTAGFKTEHQPDSLFEHQHRAVDFACENGRSACFLDTGLGKSRVEAVFASEVLRQTNKPVLILTPIAVAQQMKRECEAAGVEAKVIREDDDVWSGVNIANYERLPKINAARFGGVVLDESSILKSFAGATKRMLVESFKDTPYRLAATATPAPNDHIELGTHSEFIGNLGSMEMLCRWFINDTSKASQEWRLKGHAKADFWGWVASWARAASLPSDLGGDDEGFILPPLKYDTHVIAADVSEDTDGALFRIVDNSATSVHREKRLTINDRVAAAAEIANKETGAVVVWCETNDESRALANAIPDAVEVHGSMTLDAKEAGLNAFTFGERRVIVSKPKLAGFGLNWQHAQTQVFASISHSYEQHYQAVRRLWRFGQKKPVTAHVIISDTEYPMWKNVRRKAADHDRMKKAMAQAMIVAQRSDAGKRVYTRIPDVELPKFISGGKSNAA